MQCWRKKDAGSTVPYVQGVGGEERGWRCRGFCLHVPVGLAGILHESYNATHLDRLGRSRSVTPFKEKITRNLQINLSLIANALSKSTCQEGFQIYDFQFKPHAWYLMGVPRWTLGAQNKAFDPFQSVYMWPNGVKGRVFCGSRAPCIQTRCPKHQTILRPRPAQSVSVWYGASFYCHKHFCRYMHVVSSPTWPQRFMTKFSRKYREDISTLAKKVLAWELHYI